MPPQSLASESLAEIHVGRTVLRSAAEAAQGAEAAGEAHAEARAADFDARRPESAEEPTPTPASVPNVIQNDLAAEAEEAQQQQRVEIPLGNNRRADRANTAWVERSPFPLGPPHPGGGEVEWLKIERCGRQGSAGYYTQDQGYDTMRGRQSVMVFQKYDPALAKAKAVVMLDAAGVGVVNDNVAVEDRQLRAEFVDWVRALQSAVNGPICFVLVSRQKFGGRSGGDMNRPLNVGDGEIIEGSNRVPRLLRGSAAGGVNAETVCADKSSSAPAWHSSTPRPSAILAGPGELGNA